MVLPRLLRRLALPVLAATLVAAPATAADSAAPAENAVLHWNTQLLHATRLSRNPPPVAALHLATAHAAIFDAVNGFARRWQPWLVDEPAPAGANMEAAVAGAAHAVLLALWSESSNPRNIQLALDEALRAVPEGPAREAGLAWGRHVAAAVLARRADAGLDRPATGPFTSRAPGRWRETPPGFRPPVTPEVAHVTPFILASPAQFRAPPPPTVDSAEHARELAEVARIGARDGAARTESQTLATPFWADDLGSATPPGHWNEIAHTFIRARGLDLPETARFLALLNFTTADAGIACWDTKFFYSTWRPETALRELTPALNPHATPVPDFIPLMESPAHPDYVSGHSSFTGAATRLIARYFGTDELPFRTTSDGLPGAVREYRRLSEARDEVGMSRVWGGIHTMSANTAGLALGAQVADHVFTHALAPR